MDTHPTFVVGVGQAGIKVMNVLAEVAEENGDRDKFEFVAMDTDTNMLSQRPDDALELKLDHDAGFVNEDVSKYPYLTREMAESLGDQGAMRRRPIGRYKLDSRGSNSYSDQYDALWEKAESHYNSEAQKLEPDDASFNIYYIHSLGGGTGSGTFPLLAAMLDELANTLERTTNDIETYLGGVGVVPRITFDPEINDPIGDERYFPNAYAAMNDLDKFEELASRNKTRTLPIYAQTLGGAATTTKAPSKNEFELTSPPFDDYWLFGIDEGKIQGAVDAATGAESYAERVNQTIARSLHAISKLGESAENWADAKPYIGALDQAEVRVPHQEVLGYYELLTQREAKEDRIEEIPDDIRDLEERREELETLKQNVDEDAIRDPELRQTVRKLIDAEFPSGANLVQTESVDRIETVLDEIEQDHEIEGMIVATSLLRDKLSEERGLPAVENDRKDTVTDLWSEYNMAARPQYGGESATTIEAKAAGLEEFLHDKIDEYNDVVENWDPGLVGQLQDALPPFGPFESDREEAEEVLEKLERSREALERVESEWGRVSDMRKAVEDRRRDIRDRIDQLMTDCNEQITDLQTEREELQREIEGIDDNLESTKQSLSTEQTNQRLAILPIETENLDDLDPETAPERLDSIHAYQEHDLVSGEKLGYAMNQSVNNADAEANRNVTSTDYDFDSHRQPVQGASRETWFLYHEDNNPLKSNITTATPGNTLSSGEQNKLDYLPDPYRIELVSFHRRGPVPGLKYYQQLEDMADDGTLDAYGGQYSGDHRLGFAYLEWYSRTIKEAFEVSERVEVARPPEMDHTRVQKPDLTGGEVKNWIRSNGLDSYVWNGVMMDNYDHDPTNDFTGWRQALSGVAVSFTDIQEATPSVDLKKQWLQGAADWEEILDAYAENLVDVTNGIKLAFESE